MIQFVDVFYLYLAAVICKMYKGPSQKSVSDVGYIEEGESTAGYTFTPCVGYFACPGIG
jgi:hypothetical protein